MKNMQTSASGWDTFQFVVCASKPNRIIANLQTLFGKPLSRLGREWNMLFDICLFELVRQMIVYTELSWVVFGSLGVVL